MKIEQRRVRGPELGPQVEQTALLADPIYVGQVQGEEKHNISKEEAKGQECVISLVLSRHNKNLKRPTFKPSKCHSSRTDHISALG